MDKKIPITRTVGDIEVTDMRIETLKSIAESLKSIDQSLKKIAGGNSEKIPGRAKKSYSEKYFTYSGEKDK